MFLFRWVKRLVLLVLIIGATLYFADYQYKGKTILQHFQEAKASGLLAEGAADIRTWVMELFRVGTKAATDQITAKDKEQLENVIKNELKDQVTRIKEEAEKAGIKIEDKGTTTTK